MKTHVIQKFKENENRIISYYVGGNQDSKQCLLFLNGLYIGNETWIKQQRYSYFRENYKLIFIDYHGVGDSVEKGAGEIGFEDIVNDIKNIVDEEGFEKLYVLGYSVGGMIALWFTYRFQAQVNGLLLLNTGVSTCIHTNKMIHGLLTLIRDGVPLRNIFMLIYPWHHSELYLEKVDMEDFVLQKYAHYNRNIKSFAGLLKAIGNRPNLADVLEEITVPTFVLSSEHDFIFPLSFQEEIVSKIKNSSHYLVANCGHASFIEKHEEVNSFIEMCLRSLQINEVIWCLTSE
jgi:pimeloyl-ACP methyl ester carboxylesterase